MGHLAAYAISVAIISALLYIVYKAFLAGATFYRFNRAVLLLCYVLALAAAPLAGLMEKGYAGGAIIEPEGLVAGIGPDTNAGSGFDAVRLVPIVYAAGIAVSALLTAISAARMAAIIRRGRKSRLEGAVLVVTSTKVSPFSWWRYVVVSGEDASSELVVRHELYHVQARHWLDLAAAQLFVIFNWFNPCAYLLRRELAAVHEYEVDDRVLRSGADAREYQMLLIKKTVGPVFQAIANSLNHNQLKNRLTMMLSKKSKSVRRLCAALLLPAAVAGAAMTDFPAVAATIGKVSAVTYGKSNENSATAQERSAGTDAVETCEVLPQYPGGEMALYRAVADAWRCPEAYSDSIMHGRTIVRFVVDKQGRMGDFEINRSCGNEVMDAEAIRAIREGATQTWTPGRNAGKPVSCWFMMPVAFRLE